MIDTKDMMNIMKNVTNMMNHVMIKPMETNMITLHAVSFMIIKKNLMKKKEIIPITKKSQNMKLVVFEKDTNRIQKKTKNMAMKLTENPNIMKTHMKIIVK